MEVSPDEYASMLKGQGVPDDLETLLFYNFTTVLDGRNAYLTDGVQRHWDARPGTLPLCEGGCRNRPVGQRCDERVIHHTIHARFQPRDQDYQSACALYL